MDTNGGDPGIVSTPVNMGSLTKEELTKQFNDTIPKLDIDLTPFTLAEIRQVITTLTNNKDLFDTTRGAYGEAKRVQHTINT